MKEKIKNFIKYEYTLFVIVTIIVLLYVLFFCIVLNKPYLLNNDQWFQYNIFYKEWIRLVINFIKTGSLPMYSWNMYLGTDFYSAMGYYCTGDLFLPILLIFRNNIELGLVIETILCVYISALLMNIFLIKYDIKQEINRIFISLIYAFGGMASLYFGNYMFHRFYAFLPLLFIGLLSYFHKKKMGTFIIATAILFLQSYYFMFPTLIFLLMFSIMLEMKKHNSFKMIIRDFFVLLGCLLLGYMMSAVITLPSMMYILNNSRLGNKLSNGLFWQRNTYAGLYMSLISYIPWGIDNIFLTTSQSSHDIYYSLFIGVIAFLSSISYILKKDNKCELITLIVLLTIACLKPLSSVMHGFSVASLRWVFLLEFYLLINAAKGLDENLNNIYIYILYVVVAIVQLVLLDKNNYIDYWNVRNSLYILYACIFISLIIFILFRFNKVFGLILSVLEIVCFQCYDFYINTINSSVSNEIDYTWTIDEIQELDKDTYRFHTNYTDAQPASILNLNKSLEFKYMGTSTYNTMYDEATYKYDILSNSTVLDSSMDWVLSVDDPYSATMLGTKYWIVYKEDELPEELNFAYAYNLDYLSVYENLDYKGFGYTSNNLKYTNEFKSTADFINSILVDDETVDISKYTNIGYSKLNITSMYDNYLEANITLKEDNILLIPIPNNKGWTIKVNGKEVNSISVNGGFVGLELSKGYNEISMNFISPYFKTGLVMSGIGFIGFIMILFLKRK